MCLSDEAGLIDDTKQLIEKEGKDLI